MDSGEYFNVLQTLQARILIGNTGAGGVKGRFPMGRGSGSRTCAGWLYCPLPSCETPATTKDTLPTVA